jgi:hypothetical protein
VYEKIHIAGALAFLATPHGPVCARCYNGGLLAKRTANMTRDQHRSMAWTAFGGYVLALLAGLLVLTCLQAYRAGFSGADEPAHFLNGVFVSSYLHSHAGANPMAYAVEYYLHYPKISIGHWPPAYYGLLGVLLLALPATPQAAFIINLLVSALPAAVLGWALAWLAERRIALAGCAIYALTPLAIEGQAFFMLDQALTACCAAGAIAWIAYTRRPGWMSAAVFAALSAGAVLIKGNGWLIVLVPLFHMLLTRGWRLLVLPHLYVAALAAGLVIVPWYWLTSPIAADGFNYQAGLRYAWHALLANSQTLLRNLGYGGVPLALFAIATEYRRRHVTPQRWSVVSIAISLILATLALQSLVPAAIDDRYLAPALPAYTALTVLGAFHIYTALRERWTSTTGAALVSAIGLALILPLLTPGIAHLAQRGPKVDMRAADLPTLPPSQASTVWIIDGSSGAEGAMIAELAVRDPALRHYAVRASKLLASSDFMGTRYALKYPNEQQVLDQLLRLGAQYVVMVRLDHAAPFPHSTQLSAALRLSASPFRCVATLPHRYRAGVTEIYSFAGNAQANIHAVRQLGIPAKGVALSQSTSQ